MAWDLVDCVAAPTAATDRGRARASRLVRALAVEAAACEGDVVVAGREGDLSSIAAGEFAAIRRRRGRVGIFCSWPDGQGAECPARRPKSFFDACSPEAADVLVFVPFLAGSDALEESVALAAARFPEARITCLVGASAVDVAGVAGELSDRMGRSVRGRTVVRCSETAAGRRHAELVRACADGSGGSPAFPPVVAIELLHDAAGRPKAA